MISETHQVSKNAPAIAPASSVSGVGQCVRCEQSPVSRKYSLGVLTSRDVRLLAYGGSRWMICDAWRMATQFCAVVTSMSASLASSLAFSICPVLAAQEQIRR